MRGEPGSPALPAVVDGDHHHVAGRCQVVPAVDQPRAGAGDEAPTVDPDHHRSPGIVEPGSPDIEVQAILALLFGISRNGEALDRRWLRGHWSELICVAHAGHGIGGRGGRQRKVPLGLAA